MSFRLLFAFCTPHYVFKYLRAKARIFLVI